MFSVDVVAYVVDFPLSNRRSASLTMAQDKLYRTRRDAKVFVRTSRLTIENIFIWVYCGRIEQRPILRE
jgi:hypothetical protein